MKKIVTILFIGFITLNSAAQPVLDTVSVGAGYANQVWYSLENDNQGSDAITNWEIGIAATSSQSSSLTTSILFNSKIGSLYEIPGSSVANFASADTSGINGWTPLYNSDSTWSLGAFNLTTFLGGYDYGWGSYNTTTHNIDANRIFVIKYNTTPATYKKLYIDLNSMSGIYTINYDHLDNSMPHTHQINVATYNTKNFVYYSLSTHSVIDREPVATNWDLLFGQYPTWDYDPPYTVTGVLQNHGVEAVQVYPVNDSSTFNDWSSQTFSTEIDILGWDWKTYSTGYVIEDSTVYFIKNMSGDIWKLVFTGFSGSANGNFIFSKEKMSSLSTDELDSDNLFFTVYPNPSSDNITLTSFNTTASEKANLTISDLSGKTIYTEQVNFSNGTLIETISVANYSSGIYLMNLTTPASSITQKLIIK